MVSRGAQGERMVGGQPAILMVASISGLCRGLVSTTCVWKCPLAKGKFAKTPLYCIPAIRPEVAALCRESTRAPVYP
jgi:hypothetical protein